jgi:3-oxoacyl-[acyl-carrier-protein] synthase II
MSIYINGSSCISAQPSFDGNIETPSVYSNNRLNCIEPDYKNIIDPKQLRRMSRIMKMGLSTALTAIKNANSSSIDAIITATGYGCLEDTGNFLSKLSDPENRMMNPTAFIQSTHNTVGSHIALHLNHKGYNNTFVHSGFSFENALDDAILLIQNNEANNVLLGGFDELTNDLFTILNRLQLVKKEPIQNIDFFKHLSKGYIAGEGASFFVVSNKITSDNSFEIINNISLYKSNENYVNEVFESFNKNELIFLLGRNGDCNNDKVYKFIEEKIQSKNILYYKHLCGEYPTSSAFGLWYTMQLFSIKQISFNNEIVIYNCWNKDYHSFIHLRKC